MRARTIWEEGHWSGARVTRVSVLLVLVLAALDIVATHGLSAVFNVGFVGICLWMALAIRPAEFFRVGILPPMLMLGCSIVLSLMVRGQIAEDGAGFLQGVMSALAACATGLFIGYALVLGVLAIRQRVLEKRASQAAAHSNAEASPAPYLTTSGAPSEKSTTVVGEEPVSPESSTASRT